MLLFPVCLYFFSAHDAVQDEASKISMMRKAVESMISELSHALNNLKVPSSDPAIDHCDQSTPDPSLQFDAVNCTTIEAASTIAKAAVLLRKVMLTTTASVVLVLRVVLRPHRRAGHVWSAAGSARYSADPSSHGDSSAPRSRSFCPGAQGMLSVSIRLFCTRICSRVYFVSIHVPARARSHPHAAAGGEPQDRRNGRTGRNSRFHPQ